MADGASGPTIQWSGASRLLRARRQRPSRRAAEQADELPSPLLSSPRRRGRAGSAGCRDPQDLATPYPNLRRCLAWGGLIARAVASWPGPERVAVVATGGLSHSIGEVTMGAVDPEFDQGVLERLAATDDEALLAFMDRTIDRAGNGAQETRNWLVARGAAGRARFEALYYRAVPEWYTGLGLGQWHPG